MNLASDIKRDKNDTSAKSLSKKNVNIGEEQRRRLVLESRQFRYPDQDGGDT